MHLRRTVVRTIQLGRLLISAQLASLTGKETVECLLAYMIQVQMIRFEQAMLLRTVPKHDSILLLTPQELSTNRVNMPSLRPDL
jgi:hypothetical protein